MKFHSDLRRIKVKPFCWKVQSLPQRAWDRLFQELLGNQAALKEEKVGGKKGTQKHRRRILSLMEAIRTNRKFPWNDL